VIHKRIPIDKLLVVYHYDEATGEFIRKEDQTVVGYSWKNAYIKLGIDGDIYPAHRVAFALCMYDPEELVIDHKNSHKGDNRIVNLQAITKGNNTRLGIRKRYGHRE
jgi:hypothetical protein